MIKKLIGIIVATAVIVIIVIAAVRRNNFQSMVPVSYTHLRAHET